MNGTRDVRDVFKDAVGHRGKNFVRGTYANDARTFLRHVSKFHYYDSGILVRYTFKELGFNNEWSIDKLYSNMCKKGQYIFFGATRKNNVTHQKLLKNIKAQDTEGEKMKSWANAKPMNNDHAIGVVVDENMVGTIYDNGCSKGEKVFSLENLAIRMRWMNQCFFMDLRTGK